MRTADKHRQKLSNSQTFEPNAKYSSSNKRWKVNLYAIDEYIEYMDDDISDN